MFGDCDRSVTIMSVRPVRIQSSEASPVLLSKYSTAMAGRPRARGRRRSGGPSTTRSRPRRDDRHRAADQQRHAPRIARRGPAPTPGSAPRRSPTGHRLQPSPRRPQVDDDVFHALVAFVGLLGGALGDHALQLRRRVAGNAGRRRKRRHRIRQNRVQRVERALALERRAAGEHLVEHRRRAQNTSLR